MASRYAAQKTGGRNDEQETQRSSLPSEIRDFMTLCKKRQKIYNKTEGQYNWRCLPLATEEDEKQARKILECHVKSHFEEDEPGWETKERIASVVDKIIWKFKNDWRTEVRYSVIRVMGLQHALKSVFDYPLFKLYPNNDTRKFMLLDSHSGILFSSWNEFMEINQLPPSLLCAPSDGSYSGPAAEVDLETFSTPSCFEDSRAREEIKKKRRKELAIKGGLIALNVGVLAGTTALCFVSGPVGLAARAVWGLSGSPVGTAAIAARTAFGFTAAACVVQSIDIAVASKVTLGDGLVTGVMASTSMLNFATQYAAFAPSLLATMAVGGCVFMAVGLNAVLLVTVITEGINEYKGTGHVSPKIISRAVMSVLSFGNAFLQADEVFGLIKGGLSTLKTPLLNMIRPCKASDSMSPQRIIVVRTGSMLFEIATCGAKALSPKLTEVIQRLKVLVMDYLQNRGNVIRKREFLRDISNMFEEFITEMARAADSVLEPIAKTFGIDYQQENLQNKAMMHFKVLKAQNDSETCREFLKSSTDDKPAQHISQRIQSVASMLTSRAKNPDLLYYAQCEAFVYLLAMEKIRITERLLSPEEAVEIVEKKVKNGAYLRGIGDLESKLRDYLESYKGAALPLPGGVLAVVKPSAEQILRYVQEEVVPDCEINDKENDVYEVCSKDVTYHMIIRPFPGDANENYLGFIIRQNPKKN